MSFASPLFLWYFVPVVLATVLVAPRSWRNGIIAVASLVFYASGAGPSTLLLLTCMLVNFLAGPAAAAGRAQQAPAAGSSACSPLTSRCW